MLLLAAYSAACSSNASSSGDAQPASDSASVQVCTKMDLLFIIDDSESMREEQENLSANLPGFIDILDNFNAGALDYRVGITTTGMNFALFTPPLQSTNLMGDNGELRQECGMTKRWIEREDPDAKTQFSCVANVGLDGPPLEMPLFATQLALRDRVKDGTNEGFLRDDALLGVIIISDEDDCSRTDRNFSHLAFDKIANNCQHFDPEYVPPESTVQFLDELKGERGRWAAAVVAGESDCSSTFGDALQANKLQEFVSLAGDNAVFSSICSGDLASPLQTA
ncbi:MAG: hypothetical protein JKY56_16520, partial [Kofleriaceae bacterium]|nr:hypothetical protein [Kofleriaceae bacterium]